MNVITGLRYWIMLDKQLHLSILRSASYMAHTIDHMAVFLSEAAKVGAVRRQEHSPWLFQWLGKIVAAYCTISRLESLERGYFPKTHPVFSIQYNTRSKNLTCVGLEIEMASCVAEN